ncbi:MAG: isoquinoline 1-oxidoreductase alpha subunit [Gammaproteobacteria bacterium]|jgi:isoquinoline 1-oxidoreductase subunit alpha
MTHKLHVNGKAHEVEASDDTPLLWVLRDHLGLTGTKYGCGIMTCGACTVLVDGEPMRTCGLPVSSFTEAQAITTIEGLPGADTHPVQKAWTEHSVAQCGYCQSGMIMAASALLAKHPNPSDTEMDQAMTNICRCGTYQLVRVAIRQAAKEMRDA